MGLRVLIKGRVVSFDRIKGYGFVAPDTGGEDVFIHVNDLYSDKSLLAPGSIVEFRLEEGDRGPKASAVTVLQPGPGAPVAAPSTSFAEPLPAPVRQRDETGEELCDVLSRAEYEHELTEALLRAEPELTGRQVLDIRKRLINIAHAHGWTDR
ncbi:MAG TPA: cold shock domain-containing protein [Actinospica sp.]|nr:cold shock domain-containing protein [Actinospica sp.]